MMDPVSLATAVITISGMVGTTAKFALLLAEANHFDRDISKIWERFSGFAPLVDSVSMTLRKLCQDYADSEVVEYIAESGLAVSSARTSRRTRNEVQDMRWLFKEAADGNYFKKLWWTFRHKPEIEKLYPRMESLKLSLLLVLNNIQYDVSEDKSEKKRLRSAMKLLETTLTIFAKEHLADLQDIDVGDVDPNRSVTTLALDTSTLLLLKLSKSLRKTERVPSIQASTAHQRRMPERSTRREMLVPESTLEHPQQRPGPLPRTRPTSIHIPLNTSHGPEPQTVRSPTALHRLETEIAQEREEDGLPGLRDSGVSARSTLLLSRVTSSSSTGRTEPESPTTPITPPPAPVPRPSSFVEVRGTKSYHNLDGFASEAIQGHISQPDRAKVPAAPKLVTARRYPEGLEENFIDILKAQNLGLDIKPLEPEADGPALVVMRGNELEHRQAVGRVEVRWWTARPSGFRLMMWVVEEGLPEGINIALGKPYEERRRYYNKSSVSRGN